MTSGTIMTLVSTAPPRWLRDAALVSLLAIASTAVGMSQIPMEEHEIFVAQTAENMLHSGDWLVPHINGEYRLNKPPASYWAVAAVATVTGQQEITSALARVPTVLSAVVMVLLCLGIGNRLFGRETGLTAAMMLAASAALFKYGHNARPDMLYACLCTGMLYLWLRAQNRTGENGRWLYGMWLLAGIAILTKGPQAPAILLLGILVHQTIVTRQPFNALAALRLPGGLLLACVVALPWWWLLRQSIGGEAFDNSQLSGSLLRLNYEGLVSGYYLLRGPGMWLPWTLLIPGAYSLLKRDIRGPAGLLFTITAVAMLAFSLGSQVRHIYLLPWLPAAIILLAAGLTEQKTCRVTLWLILVFVICAFAWLIAESFNAVTILGFVAALPAIVLAANRLDRYESPAAARQMAVALSLGLAVAGLSPSLWSKDRYIEAALAQDIAEKLDKEMPLAVIDHEASIYAYQLERPVTQLATVDDFCRWLEANQQAVTVVFPEELNAEMRGKIAGSQLTLAGKPLYQAWSLPGSSICE